ncbi:MAG: hypothetical protein HC836_28515 [Richelia sp. RM2_1_2]|nr:hypothetical protein [Richelia sp. SM2_1_7]NJM23390.1 hypothetical protein [Richelia sp. SM1_7_0]NJN11505.1 hypothetical protein [Richelia sp. RM1_1_1]NJO31504.1 hypothetical protein [Richelia sp. SL_2_1]NJO62036.1 hypothetical protein [Richelia sp. RM2_1_2]
MKFNYLFQKYFNCADESEVFQYFQNTLTNSITGWDYFVDWQKVLNKFKQIEIYLNALNYLIGKEDIENEFRYLFIYWRTETPVETGRIATSVKSKFIPGFSNAIFLLRY